MNQITPQVRQQLDLLMKVHGITQAEAEAALEWIINPTLRPIVGVKEFIESPHYMNARGKDGESVVYAKLMDEIVNINCGDYSEAVLTGSIGCGKTTAALYTTAYQLYVLSCYESPHALYGLDPASEIVFIFQSLNAGSAENDYERFREMIKKAPYFQQYFKYDSGKTSELNFPHRIVVKPVSGAETATIGENIFGGMIDEINFMKIIEKSKSRADAGGSYDQAVALYNSISKRRKSRFGHQGRLPGMLCLVSSRRYPGQFTDIKEQEVAAEIARTGKTTTYLFSKRAWDIKPDGTFLPTKFPIFIGDDARKPRIMTPEEAAEMVLGPDAKLVDWIPDDLRDDFERDILTSLRDHAGVSTLAKHPFIVNREDIVAAERKDWIAFSREWVDFEGHKLAIIKNQLYKPSLPRFFHCDLAITGDSAGFAIGTCVGFTQVSQQKGLVEMMPVIHVDALLEIKPPKGGEIQLWKVRDIIHKLREIGLNIKWGSFDQFQSRDSMQLLRQAGLAVGYQSIDTTTAPYDFVKNALRDGRLSLPEHGKCRIELASLEKDTKKNKIDHPPNGSKDVSDALAGVVYGLTMRREIWALHGISSVTLPSVVQQALSKEPSDKFTKA